MRSRTIGALLAASILLPTASVADEAEVINAEARFPEGPTMIGDTLYYVEYGGHTVMTWNGEENAVFWQQEGCGPSAVVQLEGGDLLVTCYDSGSIARLSPSGETLANYDEDASGGGLLGPNDLTLDGRGGAYFTASGPWESAPIVGEVYHIDAGGRILSVADDLHYANGIALSREGTMGESGDTLYVIESEASRIIQFAVAEDGSLSDRRLLARHSDLGVAHAWGPYPDGMKVDSEGFLYVGHYSAGEILVLDPQGQLVQSIAVPSTAAPNLALSADESTLYVMGVDDTENPPYLGKVYAIDNPMR